MKIERHSQIIKLITEQDIETQDELVYLLNEGGFNVTQATISRDIRELKLSKVNIAGGRQKYIILNESKKNLNEKYIRVLQDGYLSMEIAENIVVVRTLTGMAMAVAAAIDALNLDGIAGSIAGDDTIFCAIRSREEAFKVMEELRKIIAG